MDGIERFGFALELELLPHGVAALTMEVLRA
jgi:hypothetical protein